VSFSGELAFEIHVPNAQLYAAYLALRKAGEAHGLRLFGSYAVESMRLEKGYRHWKADLVTEFTPFESGLGRFVKMEKPTFIGKATLEKAAPRKVFVSMVLDCTHAPAHGGDSIIADGRVVGTVTSAGWGHRTGKNIAMGFIDPAFGTIGRQLQVEVIGVPVPALIVPDCLYDPAGNNLRQ
ncbi:MAG: FAD-dependent oxidoreductase, partial [Paracoccaceae bacterium]|nr:FAD-dependent oxidoreductase [Paracoccaceae bacterium]